MAWQKHLVGSVEISTMIPILTKMNNREYDLETVPVNFEIPSFGSCAVLLCVREKELLSCISRSVRNISQYSYKIMSPSLLTAVSQTGQDRTSLCSPWTFWRILSSQGTNRKAVTANSFTYRPRAKAVVY